MCSEKKIEERACGSLSEALALGPRELVALVGAGGKSTLMLALGGELAGRGNTVLAATTTKVWKDQALAAGPLILNRGGDREGRVLAAIQESGRAFVGGELLESGKISAVPPEVLDALFASCVADYLVVEADGASGRPLKAPERFEPVIPAGTTLAAAVIGLEALGRRVGGDTVFRPERFREVTGLREGDRIRAEVLVALFTSPAGLFKGAPPGARRVAFLNKLDTVRDRAEALDLGARIRAADPVRGIEVVLGSIRQGFYIRLEGEDNGDVGSTYTGEP